METYFLKNIKFGLDKEKDTQILRFINILQDGDIVFLAGDTFIDLNAGKIFMTNIPENVSIFYVDKQRSKKMYHHVELPVNGDNLVLFSYLNNNYENFSILENNMIFIKKDIVLTYYTVLVPEIKQLTFSTEIPVEYRDRVISLDNKFWGNEIPNLTMCNYLLDQKNELRK